MYHRSCRCLAALLLGVLLALTACGQTDASQTTDPEAAAQCQMPRFARLRSEMAQMGAQP